MQDSNSDLEGEALRCWNASLRILSRSDKSEHQVRSSLNQKGYLSEHIETAIARLKALDYLNDSRFSQAYVRSNSSRLGHGQLRRKLVERGVSEDLIDSAIMQYAESDQLALAIQIAQRRFSAMSELPKETVERRISSLLLRRGFASSVVWSAIRQLQQRN